MRVADLMTLTTRTISPAAPCDEAWRTMHRYGIHHLPVLESGRVAGVLSYSDLAALGAAGRKRNTVAEAMTRRVVTVSPTLSLNQAAARMRGRSIGCLLVVDGEKLVGILTTTDLLHWIHANVEHLGRWKPLRASAPHPRVMP